MDNSYSYAKEYALYLLGYRQRTTSEIKRRLSQKGYKKEVIEKVIEFLNEYNFLDDAAFADAWIKNRVILKPMGKWRLRNELKEKGIQEDIIDKALVNVTYNDELAMARKLISKKFTVLNKNKLTDKFRKKIISFLLRRGFSREITNIVLQEFYLQ